MNASFVIFSCSVLLLGIAFALAFKDVFTRMVKLAADMVPIYWMTYLKLILGAMIQFGITFTSTWQPITKGETVNWAWWDWTIHLGAPVLAALLNIQAFLDRSMERADAAKAARSGLSNPPFGPTPPPAQPPASP